MNSVDKAALSEIRKQVNNTMGSETFDTVPWKDMRWEDVPKVSRKKRRKTRKDKGTKADSFTHYWEKEGKKKNARVGVDWDAQPLGNLPDQLLAKKLGVTDSTVFYARKRRGIPAYYSTKGGKK